MIKKIIHLYNFILVMVVTISAFMAISNPLDTVFPILLLPLNIYLLRLFIDFRLQRKIEPVSPQTPTIININHYHPQKEAEPVIAPQILSDSQVKDIDRRLFLKLIGSAGLTTFLFSIFTSKSHAAFFGSVPGPGVIALKDSSGNQIDPAEKHPTDGYNITQEASTGNTDYFGFTNKSGAWYILRVDNSGNYRYTKGSSDFATNWTDRTSLTYDYFDNIF